MEIIVKGYGQSRTDPNKELCSIFYCVESLFRGKEAHLSEKELLFYLAACARIALKSRGKEINWYKNGYLVVSLLRQLLHYEEEIRKNIADL